MFESFNGWAKPYARKLADFGITPNFVSTVRIILSPFVPLVYLNGGLFWTAVTVALLAFTDFIDGWLARLLGMESALGKTLDAIGDWALALPTALLLLYMGLVPLHLFAWQPWCLGLILARNVSITFVVVLQKEKADTISRPENAQRMSFLLAVALTMFLVSPTWPAFHQIGEWFLGASTFFALISWGQYLHHFRKA